MFHNRGFININLKKALNVRSTVKIKRYLYVKGTLK